MFCNDQRYLKRPSVHFPLQFVDDMLFFSIEREGLLVANAASKRFLISIACFFKSRSLVHIRVHFTESKSSIYIHSYGRGKRRTLTALSRNLHCIPIDL